MTPSEIKNQVLITHQFLYSLADETILPIELASVLLGKAPATIRTNITVSPWLIPSFIRSGRRILFVKKDIDAFLIASKIPRPPKPTSAPATIRRGRPTKAAQAARANNK